MANVTKSIQSLFISKVRIKALKYFLFNPDVPIHLRGAVRELKEEINAVRRELNRLEEIEFVRSESRGNRKYYSLNLDFVFMQELLGIFHKTFGLGGALLNNIEKLGEVQFIILTGSFIRGSQFSANKVDLVVIGQIELGALSTVVTDAEKKLGREINYTVLKGSEFILRKKRRDAFILELLMNERILVYGRNDDLIS